MKLPLPSQILAQQLKFLKKQNPRFSLRSIARDLGVSPSYLSEILSGKRPFPKKRTTEFKDAFKMDDLSKSNLDKAV